MWNFEDPGYDYTSNVSMKKCSYGGWNISEAKENPEKIIKIDYVNRDEINSIIVQYLKEILKRDYTPVEQFATTTLRIEKYNGEIRKQLEAIKEAGLLPEKISKVANAEETCIFPEEGIGYIDGCDDSLFIMVHFYTNKNGIKFVPGAYKEHVFAWDSYNNKVYVDSKGFGAFELDRIVPYVNKNTEIKIVKEVTKEFVDSIERE